MKKLFKVICSTALLLTVFYPTIVSASESEIDSSVTISAKLITTNLETNEVETTYLEVKEVKSKICYRSKVTELSTEYEVFAPIESDLIQTYDAGHGGKTEGGVTAKMTINYTPVKSDGSFKVTSFSGSWTPSHSMYYLSNRVAGCKDSWLGHSMEKRPSGNSFNYKTGWGYVLRSWGQNGPHGWSEATIRVSGMDSMSHRIVLEFNC